MRTLQVDYEYVMLPTSPEQAEQIKRALGKKAQAFIFTPEFAKRYSGSARLWRKGAKQRDEWSSLVSGQLQGVKRAFDGQVLRSVKDHGRDGRPVAVIASEDTGDWKRMPREDPMAFLYLFYERPLSEVIASASSFFSTVVIQGKERLYRIVVERTPPSEGVLELLLDERFLQQERLLRIWRGAKHDRLVSNHKLVFSGYHAYDDTPSGEKIWFPHRVSYTGYSMEGTAPDGSPLETLWKEFRVTTVEFKAAGRK